MNFDWIETRSDFDDDRPAVIDHAKQTSWTYQQFNAYADNMAHYLTSQGIKKDDVISIFAPNDIAVLDLLFACFKTGAVFLPLNWRLNPKETAAIVEDARLKLLFYAEKRLSSFTGTDQNLLHMDINVAQYDEIVNPGYHQPFQATPVEPQDFVALIYTSGTAGLPKGVMFSYESFVHNGAGLELAYKFNSNYITVVSTLMFHVLGFNDTVLPVLMSGGILILQRYFNGEELNNMVAQHHPTPIIIIPTTYYNAPRASNLNPENFRAMDYIIQGGSQPLPNIQAAFKQYGVNIINGYGLTEAPLVLVGTPENSKRKPMSIGKAVMFVDAHILNDNGEEVPTGGIGELAIKAKSITPGYWNKPAETAKALHGRYLLTGDLAKVDNDGDIFIIDRKKELIIIDSGNVSPSEVENALAEHPLVDRCVVVDYDHPKYGESIAAAIIPHEDELHYTEILSQYMRGRLAGYKVPRMYVPVTYMPLNGMQRPDRLAVRQMMNDKVSQTL